MTVNRRQMDPSLEIRKLSPRYIRELAQILETHELWKRLMSIIPKTLEKFNFVCNVTLDNPHKYNSEHFKLIENASEKYRRACTEILLDEWGTSGRVRPALGHLLYLLTKAKLFRAADYIAVDLLKQEKPQRPSTGPEALISIVLPEPAKQKDNHLEEVERSLDQIGYLDSALMLIRTNSEEAARHQNVPSVIPQIVISPDIDEDNHEPQFSVPLVVQRERIDSDINNDSDMMKFSTGSQSTTSQNLNETKNRPEISQLLNESPELSNMIEFSSETVSSGSINEIECDRPEISQLLNGVSESNLPNFDMMNESLNVSSGESSENTSEEVPAFSELLTKECNCTSSEELPELNIESSYEPNIPNLSALNNSVQLETLPNISILNVTGQSGSVHMENSVNFVPDFDALQKSTNNISEVSLPNISALGLSLTSRASSPSKSISVNISTHLLPTTLNSSQNSSDNSTKSRPCTSPLPNLYLNTLLPHFTYGELENATNNFNPEPYRSMQENGRFLGSGAFGSVFLALGLLDRPVAVKKLVLEDVQVVNIDDTVTKQFRNEVEVLSKYKHENLLSLLGYSCDGCTYCLMYEYITGGALKDRLQVIQDKLQWKERLSIAMGTARAVSYLHTAFSTPLIHRDIKSANILLDSRNNPKLGDFGLIKLSPSQNTNTATTVFGTSAYMAPEAFRGDVSVKLDTFSFGVVLLELLTSLPPMDETRDGSDLVTHIEDKCENDDIIPLLDHGTGSWQEGGINFADELFKISLKCLEEKKKRPNMVEVTGILEDLLNKLSL
ncbi:probable LRR receptor-like serine/threonine-protein kinase At2g23950 [Anoplophora glabripennis]|uniref:probable LRR receptor-like serine/threonine-protein kinase At2g23950 n=1 Tax=Anoplophora glabripennis TaxID=217634 RepID=UPI0008743260|nr:probable LRR receptor-like serine/threonine-protein kinase At2g23950 [Anoplophora glabripennis]XP_018565586.1 probable LRR receptor-like serine/threonine-protein kinase At2g23950 [Anoplophora glabripennis]